VAAAVPMPSRPSEAIRGYPRPSEAIQGHPRPGRLLRWFQRPRRLLRWLVCSMSCWLSPVGREAAGCGAKPGRG